MGELGGGGGFAGAIHADQRDDRQPVVLGQVGGAVAEAGHDFRLGNLEHATRLAAARLVFFTDGIDDAPSDRKAHVGGEQGGLEFLDIVLGELG